MANRVLFFLLGIFIGTSMPANITELSKNTVALNTLDAKGITKNEADVLTSKLRSELIATAGFTVLERDKMDEILKEQGFQQTGACTQSECLVEMGQLLGVTHVIAGSLGKIGETYSINVRLISVKTGAIVRDVSQTYKGSIDDVLTSQMNIVAKKLAGIKVEEKKNRTWLWITLGIVGVAGAGTAYAVLSKDDKPIDQTPDKTAFDLDVNW
ncbi:MAG: hypothetical protein A2268_00095 [Candidatus Raymondbacteria bacterium RifOxyA12_full_50_37]|uniref:DUF2380 domain-containing protein n=1 Tax=Candidatus Raymondbacteria bacterium RIFOXYD12_FULL_49_13 TaxID=1817890 RepID=A0A1F7F2C3_UNCRA|nr:MAG: hypothetical protein A2268_00095 [Candidatus Raymondbacteria bacterium RifOxyA12_full_50_37]OGJ92720.1 MAG: hypothetical protein A2248_04145 [Candidatus Raymondbacteria bacterium RIFOXYA2_FULL_49_16]OGJ95929.1 MAG: hypothetical protein A2487_04530 [Candidatus Raymondbacteria bacterium RifOxyC12_full_50_8]OGK00748.1 MAG: hypothetical protein A2519_19975 [Candidatus Raymondbacteria bacterium RIFOXYD12_FULL_49_13]OGP44496.1 MAG: hypothetical protein A2324_09940 [Candidatus Raymondbacteria 